MVRHINIELNQEEWEEWMQYFKKREHTSPISPSKIAAMVKQDIKNQIAYEVHDEPKIDLTPEDVKRITPLPHQD